MTSSASMAEGQAPITIIISTVGKGGSTNRMVINTSQCKNGTGDTSVTSDDHNGTSTSNNRLVVSDSGSNIETSGTSVLQSMIVSSSTVNSVIGVSGTSLLSCSLVLSQVVPVVVAFSLELYSELVCKATGVGKSIG
jgi:hypothetical protein